MKIKGMQAPRNTCLHIEWKIPADSVLASLKKETDGEITCLLPHPIQFLDQVFRPQMRIPFQHLHGFMTADGRYFLV